MADLLESLHAELDTGLKLAGLSIVLYHPVVGSGGGRHGSGNSGGGRLTRICTIESEGARCVKDDLHKVQNPTARLGENRVSWLCGQEKVKDKIACLYLIS